MLDLANWTMTLAQGAPPQSGVAGMPSPAPTPTGAEAIPQPGTPGATGAGNVGPGVSGTPLIPPGTQPAAPAGGGPTWMFPVVMVVVLGGMWFMMSRSQKKERKRKQELLNMIKKGDKIETIGGVIGSVIEARDTDVVIESAGTRLRFRRSAIANVVTDKESDSGTKS